MSLDKTTLDYLNAGGTLSNNAIPQGMGLVNGKPSPVGQLSTGEPVQPQTTTATPTTLSSANITEKVIPEVKNKIEQYSQKGSTTNPETGVVTLPTGKEADLQLLREDRGTYTGMDGLKYYNYDSTPVTAQSGISNDPLDTRTRELLNKLQTQSDELTSGMVANIKAQYENLRVQQKDINDRYNKGVNTAAIMGGTARYAAGTAEGMTASAMSYGVQKLSELDQKENEAILKVKQAQLDNNWKIASQEMDILEKIRQEKSTAARELNNKLVEANNQLRQQQATKDNAADNDIRAAILEAQKGGATPEQITKMNEALQKHDYSAAVEAGGDSLSQSTGMPGEYNFYKKDAIARGQTPVSFNEYQTLDANRKARVAAAGASIAAGTDMTTKQQQIFNTIVSKQSASPLIAANDRAVILRDLTKAVDADPTNAALQVSFIYGMIQALDTYQSAVREGEINLVEGTQGLGEKLANTPSQILKGNPLAASKVKQYTAVAKTLTDSITNAANVKKNMYKAQAISNGIGKQWEDFDQTVSELNKTSTGQDIQQSEEQKSSKIETNLTRLKTSNPKLYSTASAMYTSVNPTTGKAYTSDEILQAFPELNQ